MTNTVQELMDKVDTTALLARPLPDWRPALSRECQVYVFGENYLAKRFDQINYKFCEKLEAKEILIDNLYALLRYKYFPITSEEIDDRIAKIVASFTANLKTTLRKVSFDYDSDTDIVELLPDGCVAFRNGVYDFKNNNWLFKYGVIKLERISNTIYLYPDKYVIMWYINYDFEPLDIDINTTKLEDFIELMKLVTNDPRSKNYCFELLYNISHDRSNVFDINKFKHLCEILGYTMLQSFSQYFVMLIGSGQNGKNSLFDGCFTNRIIPRPAANDMDSIEQDRFITGSLENRSHNIFLETSAKTYTESKMIKALTGSMYQTIEQKGVNKYSGVINCKYIFAGNDQDKIKFSDTTTGFRRRINMFEIFYQWDSLKRFMKLGDYYDTTFSDSLNELKNDVFNTSTYVYFAMYGILSGTNKFKDNFKFHENDWTSRYADIDENLKDKIENIDNNVLYKYLTSSDKAYDDGKNMFYNLSKEKLYTCTSMKSYGYNGYNKFLDLLVDKEAFLGYFVDHDVYMNVRSIQNILKDISSAIAFSSNLKKTYMLNEFVQLNANKSYVKVSFSTGKMRIIK